MSAFNNSISGIWIITQKRDLEDGRWCLTNGFIVQLSVQAVDCSIFLISFCVFSIITRRNSRISSNPSTFLRTLIIITPWILPIATSTAALIKNYIHPVSGNWCWIQARLKYLRYALTHGWRFVGIVSMIWMGFYTRLYMINHGGDNKGGYEHPGMAPTTPQDCQDNPWNAVPLSE